MLISKFPLRLRYVTLSPQCEAAFSERESRKFEEGLNTKVKLDIYKRFGKSVEFKKYLHGITICDAGSRRLFKFRSGTPSVNEELD